MPVLPLCSFMACHRVTFTFTFTITFMLKSLKNRTCVLQKSYDQEGNKLQRQKVLSFIYPIYNYNWRNIGTIYIHKKTCIKRNILTIKQNTLESG
jgi:hypothetical protein